MGPRFCAVAVDSPVLALDRELHYGIPDRMAGRVDVGSVVRVPLHGRRVRAYVVALLDEPAVHKPAKLSALVSPEPLYTPDVLRLARWTADRYVAPLGLVLRHAVPGRFSAPAAAPRPRGEPAAAGAPSWLRDPGAIEAAVRERRAVAVVAPDPEGEAEAVAHAAGAAGEPALVLVPRTVDAGGLARSIPGSVALHGEMRPLERAEAWARARDGDASVVVGTRAALFVPLPKLALVAVLGAHDEALKEERWPRLHGLVVALRRAADTGAAFVAASVAPPLDLMGPRASRFVWIEPARRPRGIRPEVVSPRGGPVTPRLIEVAREAIAGGRDALVFCARKGLALRVRCEECGWYPRCPCCGAGLALFSEGGERTLRCRSCGRDEPPPSSCPECDGRRLLATGWGSERIAEELARAGLPLARIDAGSPASNRRPRPAVVVGTRAALEALRGRLLGAVGVADLDQMLGLPDFRAGERAFSTLQELAGLVMPGGRFVVQTREPEHRVVQAFTRRSFRWFAQRELPERRAAGYPPFGVVVRVDLDPSSAAALRSALAGVAEDVVGPLVRPDGRGSALVRASEIGPLLPGLRAFSLTHPDARVDVDPVDLL